MHSALLVPIKLSFEGKRNRFNKAKGQFSVTRIATFLRRRRKLRVPERKTQGESVRGVWNLYERFFFAQKNKNFSLALIFSKKNLQNYCQKFTLQEKEVYD